MARPLRIQFNGAWYHVMNRGAGKRQIFRHNYHYLYFLSLLADVTERFSAEIHAYCLMGNHYHLMLRTPEGNLQRIMRHLDGVYTQYFNRTEQTDGPLFRGRYKAVLIDAQAYWLILSRYIHRNPLEAGIIKRLIDYRWSSYPAYVGKTASPEWLVTGEILGAMGKRNAKARYRDYISAGDNEELEKFFQDNSTHHILGNDEFRQNVMANIDNHPDMPASRSERIKPDWEQVITAVSSYYKVEKEKLLAPKRGRGALTPARPVAMYLCQQVCDMKLTDIADHFGLSGYAGAGASIRNLRVQLEQDKKLSRDLNYILQDLTP